MKKHTTDVIFQINISCDVTVYVAGAALWNNPNMSLFIGLPEPNFSTLTWGLIYKRMQRSSC